MFRQDMNADKRDFGGMDGFFPEYPRSSVAKSLAAIEQSDLVPPPSFRLTSLDKSVAARGAIRYGQVGELRLGGLHHRYNRAA